MKAKRRKFLILMPVLFPSISSASCILSENTYICSGSDTQAPEFTPGSVNETSVILQDGYNLAVTTGNAINLTLNSDVINLQSDGKNSISSEDGSAVNIESTGDNKTINIEFNGDIHTGGADGFTIFNDGSGSTLNLAYQGNMDVQGAGVTAIMGTDSKMDISLDGDIHADTGINAGAENNSDISIKNNANLTTNNTLINAAIKDNSHFNLINNGNMATSDHGLSISAENNNNIYVENTGLINSEYGNFYSFGTSNDFRLNNSGEIITEQPAARFQFGDSTNIYIDNSGKLQGNYGVEIYTSSSQAPGTESKISIINSGIISGEYAALSLYGAWADYYIENSGTISASSTDGEGAIYTTGHKSFTLALKEGWNIEGRVNIDPSTYDESVADNKVLLTGDGDSSIALSRFRDGSDDHAYDSDAITGINYLSKEGSSQWTLTGEQLSGGFESVDINQGSVLLDNATILMKDTSKSVNNNASVYVNGHSTIEGSLKNAGSLYINNNKSQEGFNTLNVTGNYEGVDGSRIVFNSALEGDDSLTDRLMINGDTSGTSNVQVNNLGGRGAQTVEGIELISVAGQSDGTFAQEGRIVAGAYDYTLVRGQNANASNWYLTSKLSPVDPTDPPVTPPVDPSEPPVTPPVTPSEPPVTPPVTPPAEGEHVNRPEGGSYIANLAAANTLFNTRLHDRSGETEYVDALTGEKNVTSLWLRQVGGHNSWHDGSGQLKTQSNSYVAQLGGDVARWSTDGVNRGHIGLMAGYANSHSNTHSSVTGYGSRGSVNGYSTGIYGTWFARDADKTGLYVDSWLQYSWFNNHVNGEKLASESYKSRGLTASLETGYTLKMGEFTGSRGTRSEWFIQPQAQATWMGVKAGKHHEDNGTRVNSEGDGNIQTRLGMRAYLKSHHAMDEGKDRTFEPFIEANWLHNTRSYSAKMDDVRISQAGARNIGEVKVGVEGQINPRLNLWGNVGTQMGDEGYHDSTAMIGVKYHF